MHISTSCATHGYKLPNIYSTINGSVWMT